MIGFPVFHHRTFYAEVHYSSEDLLIISTVTGRFIGSTASIGLYVKSRNLFSRRGGSYGRYPLKHYYIRTLYLLQTVYALSMRHNSRHMREGK
jgi:hypothetical protein